MLWVGGAGGMEADLVKREGVRFEAIPAGQVHGVSLRALPGNLWQLGRGFLAARRILRKFRPDVLLFTGGYLAVPMAFAARLLRQGKSLLFVPDIEPGWALKTLARFADQIALSVERLLCLLQFASKCQGDRLPVASRFGSFEHISSPLPLRFAR